MRKFARWFMVLVLALDIVVATVFFAGGTTQSFGQQTPQADSGQSAEFEAPPGEPTRWTREALQLLGQALAARAQELDQRQLEIEEMLRSAETLKRAGAGEETTAKAVGKNEADARVQPRPAPDGAARQELFARLSKTYENMEPESAAAALSQLAVLDKGAVVELILGWKPRVSGAVLDALTLSDPALAADLSYGIWLLSGKNKPGAGSTP